MTILKGNTSKSIIVDKLMGENTLCIVYENYEVPFEKEYFMYDKKEHSLQELFEAIKDLFTKHVDDISYEYFILYTNNTERELSDIISWLMINQTRLPFRSVIVTCKLM